jgi:hypothetical protein
LKSHFKSILFFNSILHFKLLQRHSKSIFHFLSYIKAGKVEKRKEYIRIRKTSKKINKANLYGSHHIVLLAK